MNQGPMQYAALLLLCLLAPTAASLTVQGRSHITFRIKKGLRKLHVHEPAGSNGPLAAPASSGMASDTTFTSPTQGPVQSPQAPSVNEPPYEGMSDMGRDGYRLRSTGTCPALPAYYGDHPGAAIQTTAESEPQLATTGNATVAPPFVLVRPPFPGLRNSHRYATPAPLPIQRPQRSSDPLSPSVITTAAVEAAPSASPPPASQLGASDFAQTSGTKFITDGGDFYFAGTNAYYLLSQTWIPSEQSIVQVFGNFSMLGIKVVRFWAFNNGDNGSPLPLQPEVGTFDEDAFQRLDLILDTAARFGIRLIAVFGNCFPEYNGFQWWVDQTLGLGHQLEEFYWQPKVLQAYKDYMSAIIMRTNTVNEQEHFWYGHCHWHGMYESKQVLVGTCQCNGCPAFDACRTVGKQAYSLNYLIGHTHNLHKSQGLIYRDDPAIFAWELANEPQTSDGYERRHHTVPGMLLYNWVDEMSTYVRSLDTNHMISYGGIGFEVSQRGSGGSSWLNNGLKGEDFAATTGLPNIDFGTVHVYPSQWSLSPSRWTWVLDNYIADRAQITADLDKPILLEEFGFERGYLPSRNTGIQQIQDAANAAGYAGTMVWELLTVPVDDWTYDFNATQDGSEAILAQISYYNSQEPTRPQPQSPQPSEPPTQQSPPDSPQSCTNIPPDSLFSCQQQVQWHPHCLEDFLGPGICDESCGRCGGSCTDIAPSGSSYTCAEQVTFHPGCTVDYLGPGFCDKSCGRCNSAFPSSPAPPPPPPECTDLPPPGSIYSCTQQVTFHPGCTVDFLRPGFCDDSCGRCNSAVPSSPTPPPECTDLAPPGSTYTCKEQALFHPGCRDAFLAPGFCDFSCGRCGTRECSDDPPPGSPYTCEQQVAFHPGCLDGFLQSPICDHSCGRC